MVGEGVASPTATSEPDVRLYEVGGQRVTLRHVSTRPFPNRAGDFQRTRLSGRGTQSALTAYPLTVHDIHRTVADVSLTLFPFPL